MLSRAVARHAAAAVRRARRQQSYAASLGSLASPGTLRATSARWAHLTRHLPVSEEPAAPLFDPPAATHRPSQTPAALHHDIDALLSPDAARLKKPEPASESESEKPVADEPSSKEEDRPSRDHDKEHDKEHDKHHDKEHDKEHEDESRDRPRKAPKATVLPSPSHRSSTGGAAAPPPASGGSGDAGNAIQKIQVPKDYPQLLAIPLDRRPLFPGFYKTLAIKDPAVISAIESLVRRRQPYIGIFLTKEETDISADVITDISQVNRVGVFAQITNIFADGSETPDNPHLNVVVYPHRRIRMTGLVDVTQQQQPSGAAGAGERTMPSVATIREIDTSDLVNGVAVTPLDAGEAPKKPADTASGPDAAVPSADADATASTPAKPETEHASESTLTTQARVLLDGEEAKEGVERSPSPSAEPSVDIPYIDGYHPVNLPLRGQAVSIADVENLADEPYTPTNRLIRAITSEILAVFKELSAINPLVREQIVSFSIQNGGHALTDPTRIADFAATISSGNPEELQDVLESLVIEERLHKALVLLKKELAGMKLQIQVTSDVDKKINRRTQEYFLREQLKSIKKELGMEDDGKSKLIATFRDRIKHLTMPPDVLKIVHDEIRNLEGLEPAAHEYSVARNYLDWLTQIPWGKTTPEKFVLRDAIRVLDEDHYGLKDVKDRILEFIAVGKLRGTVEGKILCLSGPPGVGKTSVGKSVARALGRQFYRFSVGGLHDVAEIKGHRRTYVGAMPGKLIQALKKVQTSNPLVMIDEIDKLGRDGRGDPASALLELLDPEQNSAFMDHYLDVPVDLSKVLFICTANVLEAIPGPLLDRMEVIRVSGYVQEEKVAIAQKYLCPQSLKSCGLTHDALALTPEAIEQLIRYYCRESGVRNLKKHIDKIYRKVALQIVRDEEAQEPDVMAEPGPATTSLKTPVADAVPEFKHVQDSTAAAKDAADIPSSSSSSSSAAAAAAAASSVSKPHRHPIRITPDNLHEYVGTPPFHTDRMYDQTPAGVVMGLAWTSMGGSALYIESVIEGQARRRSTRSKKAAKKPASDNEPEDDGPENDGPYTPTFQRTGQIGDVMRESTTIAYTYAKAYLLAHHPGNDFFQKTSIHLHVPEGATPKDGPSAGSTMATSLLSLALGRPVIPDVAMTGELTVTGKVLRIGGVKEKVMAARRAGVKEIIFPAANRTDWNELADYVTEGLRPHFVETYEDIARIVFPDEPSGSQSPDTQ